MWPHRSEIVVCTELGTKAYAADFVVGNQTCSVAAESDDLAQDGPVVPEPAATRPILPLDPADLTDPDPIIQPARQQAAGEASAYSTAGYRFAMSNDALDDLFYFGCQIFDVLRNTLLGMPKGVVLMNFIHFFIVQIGNLWLSLSNGGVM